MTKTNEPRLVYVVTCYQNILGVYTCLDDAALLVKETVAKNRPANIATMPLIEPNIQI